jgi:NADPH-dependent 2,4-dienoyl-CoA reductase/sulfur reductase-like enzyme
MLRRQGHDGEITMIDPDEAAPYDRPNLSKDYLAGAAPEEWIPLRSADFYGRHGVSREVARVGAIDVGGRAVLLADGRRLPFDGLLLATGAAPIRLEIAGAELPHVHVLRSLADCRSIIAAAAQGERVVVIGASFIGMEAAASLGARGLRVTVVAPDRVPFERSLGRELGDLLRERHEANGVSFRLGRTATRIERREWSWTMAAGSRLGWWW